jgi:hypothetical protein
MGELVFLPNEERTRVYISKPPFTSGPVAGPLSPEQIVAALAVVEAARGRLDGQGVCRLRDAVAAYDAAVQSKEAK